MSTKTRKSTKTQTTPPPLTPMVKPIATLILRAKFEMDPGVDLGDIISVIDAAMENLQTHGSIEHAKLMVPETTFDMKARM